MKLAHSFCKLSEKTISVAGIFRKQNTYPEHSEQELLASLLVFPPTTVTLVFLLESGPAPEGRSALELCGALHSSLGNKHRMRY